MRSSRKSEKKPVVALIYDFDGTLSPGNMQEFGFIQAIGKKADAFWEKTRKLAREQDASGILCYMKLMIDEARSSDVQLKRESFKEFGSKIDLFPGVKEWFSIINEYGNRNGVSIEHYINSSGLIEMIEGSPIAHEFKKIFACSFLYDVNGVAVWPGVAVDFTTKTQFLFKINKGIDSISDNKLINEYLPEEERPVPFKRMIYFGDGETDIPCMKLVKQSGGNSIAVYKQRSQGAKERAQKLLVEDRVNFVCQANYSQNSEIYRVVTTIIEKIKGDIAFETLEKKHAIAVKR